MGRQIRLCVAAAGNGGDDGCRAVSVTHIVLKNDYGAAAFLLRADAKAQVGIAKLTPKTSVNHVCFLHIGYVKGQADG